MAAIASCHVRTQGTLSERLRVSTMPCGQLRLVARSLHLDAGFLDQGRPPGDLVLDEARELLR